MKKIMKKIAKVLLKITLYIISITLIGLFVAIGGITAIIEDTPKTNLNEFKSIPETSHIYDEAGNILDDVPTSEKRIHVTSEDIPKSLKDAYIATEDRRFYEHNGVDFRRLLGAVVATAKSIVTGKGEIEGGSTITQQLVKTVILTPDRTITRKVQEMVLANLLSNNMSKDDILTTYLNTIHLGGYANGVEVASNQYFGKHVKDINLLESAFLAGITQSPNYYYPYSQKNIDDPSNYLNRTETVLDSMLLVGSISEEEYKQAVADLHNGKLVFKEMEQVTYNLKYEWFNRQLLENVKQDLKDKYNYSDEVIQNLLSNGGLKIYSTMDRNLQGNMENIIYNMDSYIDVATLDSDGDSKQPQAAATLTDYKTGKVKAIVGGREEQAANTINRAVSPYVLRPTGSTVKPFTVYAPALDTGLYTKTSTVKDEPLSQVTLTKYGYTFQPQNDQLTYYGNITLQSALARSLNTVALNTVDKLGLKTAVAYGEGFGFKYNNVSKNSIAAVALGQFNNDPEDIDGANTTMVAEAYGTFGNDGYRTESILYTKVVDKHGTVILDNTPETFKVISNKTAYDIFKMMEATLPVNTSNVVLFDNMAIAGKSGTSENNENLWFGGLTPYYSCAVWVGADIPVQITSKSGVPMYGNNTSGHLWREIMKYAHKDLPYKTLTEPTVVDESFKLMADTNTENKAPNGTTVVKPTDTIKQQYDAAKKEEEERIKKEYQAAEEKRQAEEVKKAEIEKQKAEEANRKAEEERKRLEEEAKKAEEERKKKEEEDKKKEEEDKKKEEEDKKAEEENKPEQGNQDTDGPISFN